MISKNLSEIKGYYLDYTKIENYELAIADNSQTWDCHHRNEPHKGKEIAKEKLRKVNSGKKLSEETKKKIGEASKKLGLKPPSKKGMHWKLVNGKRVYYK